MNDFADFQNVAAKVLTHPDLQSAIDTINADPSKYANDQDLKKLFVDRGIIPNDHTTLTKVGGDAANPVAGIRFCVSFNDDAANPTYHCISIGVISAS